MRDREFEAYRWMHDRQRWIPIDTLVDGALYLIHARNAHIGIWNAENCAFVIAREKFGHLYLFEECHWDIGEALPEMALCGTAKPFILLDPMPVRPDDLLDFLIRKEDGLPLVAAYERVRALDG